LPLNFVSKLDVLSSPALAVAGPTSLFTLFTGSVTINLVIYRRDGSPRGGRDDDSLFRVSKHNLAVIFGLLVREKKQARVAGEVMSATRDLDIVLGNFWH
jgi:hypothetical protein